MSRPFTYSDIQGPISVKPEYTTIHSPGAVPTTAIIATIDGTPTMIIPTSTRGTVLTSSARPGASTVDIAAISEVHPRPTGGLASGSIVHNSNGDSDTNNPSNDASGDGGGSIGGSPSASINGGRPDGQDTNGNTAPYSGSVNPNGAIPQGSANSSQGNNPASASGSGSGTGAVSSVGSTGGTHGGSLTANTLVDNAGHPITQTRGSQNASGVHSTQTTMSIVSSGQGSLQTVGQGVSNTLNA